MELVQHILVYLTVGASVFYLLKVFVLPKSLFRSKGKPAKACGQEDCGCH
ncbi:hypothetical protein [Maribacter sp. 2307ULW6-5]